MIRIVSVLFLLFLIVMLFSAMGGALFAYTDTFRGRYTQRTCAGPCAQKSERLCCSCAKCAWFIDDHYNGQCIRRGTGLDSCLRYPSYYYGHRYNYYPQRWW